MNTYTGGTLSNKQNGESAEKANTGDDLFLSGGFDSFGGAPETTGMGQLGVSPGQVNAGMGQLGSVDYSGIYGNDEPVRTKDPWANQRINLNLWGQLFHSFLPFKYDRYKGLSIGAAKDFVNFFVRMYMTICYLLVFIVFLQYPGVMEYFKSGNMGMLLVVIIFGVSYAASIFFGTYLFRLRALIYRLIFGNLLMAIEGKKITSTNMYLVSIYACVPWMVIRLLAGIGLLAILFFTPFLQKVPSLWLFSVMELVMPVIIMAIAIPKME